MKKFKNLTPAQQAQARQLFEECRDQEKRMPYLSTWPVEITAELCRFKVTPEGNVSNEVVSAREALRTLGLRVVPPLFPSYEAWQSSLKK